MGRKKRQAGSATATGTSNATQAAPVNAAADATAVALANDAVVSEFQGDDVISAADSRPSLADAVKLAGLLATPNRGVRLCPSAIDCALAPICCFDGSCSDHPCCCGDVE